MPFRSFGMKFHPYLKPVAICFTSSVLMCSICNAQSPVCPGERSDIQATVYDKEQHLVVDGYIEFIDNYGQKRVPLDTGGQFYTYKVCGHPPDSCQTPTVSYRFGHSLFSSSQIHNLTFSPDVSFRRNLFTPAPGLYQAVAYADVLAEAAQQSVPQVETKPWWRILFESVGGAALITVIGGGIIGGLLANFLQRRAKEREILLNQLDAEKQRRLQRTQVYLDEEIKVVADILEVVTASSSKAENLILLTTDRFQLDKNNSAELKDYRKQVRSDFNAAVDVWKSGRETLGAMLGTYHKRDSAVFLSWINIRKTTTSFLEKSNKLYDYYYDHGQLALPQTMVDGECNPERDALEKAISEFSDALFLFRSEFAGRDELFEGGQISRA